MSNLTPIYGDTSASQAVSNAFESIGSGDVDNVAGATDVLDLPDYVGDGQPQIIIITPAVDQAGNVSIQGSDANDLYVTGYCINQVSTVATTTLAVSQSIVTNLVKGTLASAVSNKGFIEMTLTIRTGLTGVLNCYRILGIGNGVNLQFYAKKEF